ncbi:MAG: hypothetical protein WCE21_03930 [Candidatus Babeliales bacterium]
MKKNLLCLMGLILCNLLTPAAIHAASGTLYIHNNREEPVIVLLLGSLNITRKVATTTYSDWPSESTTYIYAPPNCHAGFTLPKELQQHVPSEFTVGLVYAQEIPKGGRFTTAIPCNNVELLNTMVVGVKESNNTYTWYYKHKPVVKNGTDAVLTIDPSGNGLMRIDDATRELFRQAQQAMTSGAMSVFDPKDTDDRVTKQTRVLNALQKMFQN